MGIKMPLRHGAEGGDCPRGVRLPQLQQVLALQDGVGGIAQLPAAEGAAGAVRIGMLKGDFTDRNGRRTSGKQKQESSRSSSAERKAEASDHGHIAGQKGKGRLVGYPFYSLHASASLSGFFLSGQTAFPRTMPKKKLMASIPGPLALPWGPFVPQKTAEGA